MTGFQVKRTAFFSVVLACWFHAIELRKTDANGVSRTVQRSELAAALLVIVGK